MPGQRAFVVVLNPARGAWMKVGTSTATRPAGTLFNSGSAEIG
jgi:hypothetical protein